ncbi:MAG: porin [Pseudolabrys sp.]|nr:porin [Pseudolabrys sp.]
MLGTAAGLVAMTGAQAADLPVKAKPVQYVKICSLYGAGFYYIPGTDTCLKVGGFVRAEVNFNAGGSFSVRPGDFDSRNDTGAQNWRVRAGVSLDARSQTEYGTLRSYMILANTSDNSGSGSVAGGAGPGVGNPGGSGRNPYTRLWANAAFIQFAGFTAGKTGSFFDFDNIGYSNQTNFWGSALGGGGIEVFAYTAQLGNGLSASIAAENAAGHRVSVLSTNGLGGVAPTWQYGNQSMPDIVGNVRIDQAWGSAQVMAAWHEVRASNAAGFVETATADASAYALGAGLRINLPMLGKGDYLIGQVNYAKGAMLYVASSGAPGFALTSNNTLTRHQGPIVDAVVTTGNNLDLTTGWSFTGGFEHNWVPGWKTSLYGAYGKVEYSDAASAQILPVGALAGSSANFSFWQVGSRTVWTPVTNLDLSVDVMYNKLNTAFATGAAAYADKSWWSGMFRVQRNFYP